MIRMFKLQKSDELTCIANGNHGDKLYIRHGSMIAFQGNVSFEKMLLGSEKGLASKLMGAVKRKFTDESLPLVQVTVKENNSVVYLAHKAYHVEVVTVHAGERLVVESDYLLAFTEGITHDVEIFAQGLGMQKGIFTTILRGTNQGGQVAILSDGNPLILHTPCKVDPDSVVCWNGHNPTYKMGKLSYKNLIGHHSGESYYLTFSTPGYSVMVQPKERNNDELEALKEQLKREIQSELGLTQREET